MINNYQTKLDNLIRRRDLLRKSLIDSIVLAVAFSVMNLIVVLIGVMVEDAIVTSICSANSLMGVKNIVEYLEIVDGQNL